MPIKQFDLAKPPKNIGICITGPVGTGKTTLIGTMPGNGLLIDIPATEGGGFVLGNHSKRIKGVYLEEWEDIDEVYWALAKGELESLGVTGPLHWIAIDSITGMLEMGKRKIIRERDRNLGDDPHKITLQEWGWIGQLVGEMVYRFQKLPYVKIWVAQERQHGGYEGDDGPVQLGPSVTRSVLLMLNPPMTIMGRLSVEGLGERRVLTIGPPGGKYMVKARAMPGRKLPNRILEPNLKQILNYLFRDGPRPRAARDENEIILA